MKNQQQPRSVRAENAVRRQRNYGFIAVDPKAFATVESPALPVSLTKTSRRAGL